MAQNKRGLGRGLNDMGLDELLSNVNQPISPTAQMPIKEGELKEIDIDLIQAGQFQPRKNFDETSLNELADSIRSQGIIQPIVLRKLISGRFEIIAGERRWRATQIAGLKKIPALIKDISDEGALALGLIENIQREDLNAIEEAQALQRLIQEFAMSHEKIAEAIGKSRTTITNLLRLLTLEREVKAMIQRGEIEMGHARALLSLEGVEQIQAAKEVVSKNLSVRETERLVNTIKKGAHSSTKLKQKTKDPSILSLQTELSDKLGTTVSIEHDSTGKGKLIIQYHSLDALDGILEHIK